MYDTGSPQVAASTEMSAALGDIRRLDTYRALESTKRLVETFPNEPAAHVLRALALYGAWLTDPTKKYQAFADSLARLDRIDPRNPWDDVFRGLYLMNSGKNREAVEGFGRVLARDDLTEAARANILSLRGAAEASQGRFTAAFADLDEAVRLDPANDVTFFMLAASLFEAGRTEEAVARARQAVALNPTSSQNNNLLGVSLGRLGRWDEALPFLGRACDSERSQGTCGDHALGLLQAGHKSDAAAKAKEASSMSETGAGQYALACYHALLEDRAEALRLLRRSVDLGFSIRTFAEGPGLATLRGDVRFESLVAEVKRAEVQRR